MAKFNNTVSALLKSYFEAGDKPTEEEFAEFVDAVQEGIQEHQHTPSGGQGSGTGDADPVVNVQHGLDEDKTEYPLPGDVYLALDTQKLYICYESNEWCELGAV